MSDTDNSIPVPEQSQPIEMPSSNPASPQYKPIPDAKATEETTLSRDAQIYTHERDMFSRGARANNMQLPGNFNTFEDYFDSLKEAQGQYTEARQELSSLRAQMAQENLPTPGDAEQPEEGESPQIEGYEDLEIPEPEAEEAEEELGEDEYLVGMTEEEADAWSQEYYDTGTFSEQTMDAILDSFPGVTEEMVDIYFAGLQYMESQSVSSAIDAAGSQENLQELFNWASQNLSPAEREAANDALQGPLAGVTIQGLLFRMQQQGQNTLRAQEPQSIDNRVAPSTAGAAEEISGFSSPMEMNQALSDPRYGNDPNYTEAVSVALSRTPWVTGN